MRHQQLQGVVQQLWMNVLQATAASKARSQANADHIGTVTHHDSNVLRPDGTVLITVYCTTAAEEAVCVVRLCTPETSQYHRHRMEDSM